MAKIIPVGKGISKYNVVISKNALTQKNIMASLKAKNKILVITDSGIPKSFINDLKNILKKSKKKLYFFEIKEGEKSKSFSTYTKILSKLADLKFDRSDALIAFGGGVVGDVTGFCAATFLRGIDFIQIPTTLLSQDITNTPIVRKLKSLLMILIDLSLIFGWYFLPHLIFTICSRQLPQMLLS